MSQVQSVRAYLIQVLGLLDLCFKELLNAILYNLSALLHGACECRQRLLQFGLHLRCIVLMLPSHGFHLTAQDIQRTLQTTSLLRAERLSTERKKFPGVLILDGCSSLSKLAATTDIILKNTLALTAIERFQFVGRKFGSMHTIQKGPNTSIFLAPEIVGDCELSALHCSWV
jgi:hypothetical protein